MPTPLNAPSMNVNISPANSSAAPFFFNISMIVYKEKKMMIIRMPKIRPVMSPHLAPSKILSATLRRSFSNFPISSMFLC